MARAERLTPEGDLGASGAVVASGGAGPPGAPGPPGAALDAVSTEGWRAVSVAASRRLAPSTLRRPRT